MSSIGVVIPTFKASPFIRETLESVFAQSRLPAEVIIVDDCSPDDTLSIVQGIASRSPLPIRIVPLSKNSGGPAKPMNVGVEACQCDCVALLDQDDLMTQDRLAWHLAGLERPEVDFTFGWISRIEGDGTLREGHYKVPPERLLALAEAEISPGNWRLNVEKLYADVLVRGSLVGASNMAFRKTLWNKVGGFREDHRICWDYEFFCQATRWGGVSFSNACVAHYRVHGANFHQAGDLCTREWVALLDRHYAKPLWPIDRGILRQVLAEQFLEIGYRLAVEGKLAASLSAYKRACYDGAGLPRCLWRGVKAVGHTVRSKLGVPHRLLSKQSAPGQTLSVGAR